MTQKQSSILVGVFQDQAQAQKAYDDLRNAGFGQDYVGMAEHGKSEVDLRKELVNAGVPSEDADYYQREFNAGRFIVTVRAGGLGQDSISKATNILKQDGAYDANSQRTQKADNVGANVRTDTSSPYFDIDSTTNPITDKDKSDKNT